MENYLLVDNTCIFVCPDTCAQCRNEECIVCNDHYYLSNSTCLPCSNGCKICNDSSHCESCMINYKLVNETCTFVCPALCNHCDNQKCVICIDQYYLDSNDCKSCSNGCKSCNDSSQCQSCIENYDLVNQSCVYICPDNCNLCPNKTCTSCDDQYYLYDNICVHCSSNCKTCSSIINCEICNAGYYLFNSRCILCDNTTIINSTFSNDRTSIIIIFASEITNISSINCSNIFFTNDSFGINPVCYIINNQITLTFGENSSFSNTSEFSIYLPALFSYLCIPSNKYTIHTTAEYSIMSCLENYKLIDNICVFVCPDICKHCQNQKCVSCNSQYYLSNNACLPCIENCDICSDNGTCITCMDNYELVGGNCTFVCPARCGNCQNQECVICTDQYYFSNDTCLPCSSGCKSCNDSSNCLTCMNNYNLVDQSCAYICPVNCNSCQNQTCTSCNDQYYLYQSICAPCSSNCKICSNVRNCKICNDNYLVFNSRCVLCDNAAIINSTFSNDRTSITIIFASEITNTSSINCIDIFFTNDSFGINPSCYIINNQVTLTFGENSLFSNTSKFSIYLPALFSYLCIPPNDYTINITAQYSTILCSENYILIDNICVFICPDTCAYCKNQECAACNNQYYLYNSACLPCSNNCQICNDSSHCQLCMKDFHLVDQSCNYICPDNCKSCLNQTCEGCIDQYYLDSNECKPCSAGCKVCNGSSHCQSCLNKYSFINQSCSYICPDNCNSCPNKTCVSCNDQYYLYQSICAPCSSNCKTCTSILNCEICNQDYLLYNHACVHCDNATIINSSFSSDFASITVIFASIITNTSSTNCGNIFFTNDSFGNNPICSITNNQVTLTFGKNSSFSNTSEFSIYLPALFSYLCIPPNNYTINAIAEYSIAPIPLYAVIVGVPKQSLTCVSSNLIYYADKLTGIYSSSLIFSWDAIITPQNNNIAQTIRNQTSLTITVPLSLFNGIDSQITVSLTITNSLKYQISSTISTEVVSNEELSLIIDAGSQATIKASRDNYFIARVTDLCGKYCRANFYWSFVISDNSNFDSSIFTNLKVSNILAITKNMLSPGYTYNFSVTASCSSISGSANISIFVESSPLVVIFDRTNSSISKRFDLFINGIKSYDPDKKSTLSYL